MDNPPNRVIIPPLVDLALLAAALKGGFMLSPTDRPEFAMLGAALVVQLFVGPRTERFVANAMSSGLVTFALYLFYWRRGLDGWPLLPWFLLLPVWRSLAGRTAGFSERMLRIDRGLRAWAQKAAIRAQWLVERTGLPSVHVIGLVLAGGWLMWPYLSRGIVGAGDAHWYANTVADYVVQMRAGFFPLWAGQSDYSFYGGIFPLRLAPYLAHLAGLVDLVTARQLPPYAVMNVALVASLVGGMVAMYLCLGKISAGRPWSMLGLALCYGLCPGVLGLVYAQDLYMSFCALPFLPVAFFGAVRSFTRNDLAARMLMAGGVAAAWLAHPPIGMWCGIVIGATQAVRWFSQPAARSTWKHDACAAGIFVLLAGYSFVSVHSLGPLWSADSPASSHVMFIKAAFPENWRPLHAPIRDVSNLQLGYGLTALGLLVAVNVRGAGHRLPRLFLGCAAGLIVLVLPIPFVTEHLWRAMPQMVLNITNVWPMQRLLVVAAVCVVVACAVWLGERPEPRASRMFGFLLGGALLWGLVETTKFIGSANIIAGSWSNAATAFRPENRVMTHSAIGPHPVQPRYFNHGVTDVRLEHRFLSLADKEIIRNATDPIIDGFGPGTGGAARRLTRQFSGQLDADNATLNLEPHLVLESGKHYLLALEFLDHDYTGALRMEGRDFARIYGLPEAGNERAFGANPKNARWLALWQTTGQPEEVRLRWLPTGQGARIAPGVPFANFELREYDPAALDVVLESLLPYRARVNAPVACYLETPRLSLPGYRAVVDGRPAPVEFSPDGFVMVRLEPGRHVLELHYAAPRAAQLAYYIGLAGWLGLLGIGVRHFRPKAAARRP